jgi:nicotinamidase-related amidase
MRDVLLALHYQNEVLHAQGKIKVGVAAMSPDRQALVDRAGRLLAGARQAGVPIVSVRIAFRPDHKDVIQNCKIFRNVVAARAMTEGSWGAEFHDGLGPEGDEFVVTHNRVNAFFNSTLEGALRALRAGRLIVAGVSTNSVVETTVRHAADMGYEVLVVADACSAGDPRLHEASLENMRFVADIVTTEGILARLPSAHSARAQA